MFIVSKDQEVRRERSRSRKGGNKRKEVERGLKVSIWHRRALVGLLVIYLRRKGLHTCSVNDGRT